MYRWLLVAIFSLVLPGLVHGALGEARQIAYQSAGTIDIVLDSGDGWTLTPVEDNLITCELAQRRSSGTGSTVYTPPSGFDTLEEFYAASSQTVPHWVGIRRSTGDETSFSFSTVTTQLTNWSALCIEWDETASLSYANISSDEDEANVGDSGNQLQGTGTVVSADGSLVIAGLGAYNYTSWDDDLTVSDSLSMIAAIDSANVSRAGIFVAAKVASTGATHAIEFETTAGQRSYGWSLVMPPAASSDPEITITGGPGVPSDEDVEVVLDEALSCGSPTQCIYSSGDVTAPAGASLTWECPQDFYDYVPSGDLELTGWGMRAYTLQLACMGDQSQTATIQLEPPAQTDTRGASEFSVDYDDMGEDSACAGATEILAGDDYGFEYTVGEGDVGTACQPAIAELVDDEAEIDLIWWSEADEAWQTTVSTEWLLLEEPAELSDLACQINGDEINCSVAVNPALIGDMYWLLSANAVETEATILLETPIAASNEEGVESKGFHGVAPGDWYVHVLNDFGGSLSAILVTSALTVETPGEASNCERMLESVFESLSNSLCPSINTD